MVKETEERQETREGKGATDLGTIAILLLGVWYFFLRKPGNNGNNGPPPNNGVPQIQILEAAWQTDYTPGDTTTCRFIIKNLSNFAAKVYVQVYLGYQAWGTVWTDATNRVWVTVTLPALGQVTSDARPVVLADCPVGPKVGRLYVYAKQDVGSACLAYQNLANAANIVSAVPQVQILSQSWL